MRYLLRLLLLLITIPLAAQNFTTVSASNTIGPNGIKLNGSVCFTAVNSIGTPIGFQIGGGGLVVSSPYCTAVTNGVISMQVANPANTLPAGILYIINISSPQGGYTCPLATFSGATLNLDTYVCPTIVAGIGPGIGISLVNTTSPITGGPITSVGTIGLSTACVNQVWEWNSTAWVCVPPGGYIFQVNGTGLTTGDTVNLNATTPAVPSNGINVVFAKSTAGGTDSVSAAVIGDGNAAHSLLGNGVFGTAYTLPGQYAKLRCQSGLGDGLNAMTAGTYLQSFCYNDSGVTWTIIGIKCFTDNNGTSTLNAAGNTLGALLTGAVTCTNAFAAGTQSANVLLTAGDYVKFTFVGDGTSKQTTWVVSMTQ